MSGNRAIPGAGRSSSSTAADGDPLTSVVADIIAVLTLTISSVGFAASLAVLIFGGTLESGLSRAIASFLIGGGVMSIVVARRSNIVPVATFVQEGPAIVMAVVAADFIARDGVEISDVFVLFVVTMVAASLATVLMARIGLGRLCRCAPALVVGTFVGGVGWLLFKGGFDVMVNTNLRLVDLPGLFEFDAARFWLPGLALGVVAWLAGRSQRLPDCTIGIVVCVGMIGFYAVVAIASSVSAVKTGGWLIGPFVETGGSRLVTPGELAGANWTAIAKTAPGIASVVAVSCVAQLLHLTGIRAELEPQLDVDAELQTSATANLAASLFGVTPGFQGFGCTVLLKRQGATRRVVAVIAGGFLVVFGLIGSAAVGYVPRLIIGALLVMIGLALLEDWLRGVIKSASAIEQLLGVATVGAVAWRGLLSGIAVGMIAAGVLFVVRYGQVDPVRRTSTGREVRSRVDRPPYEVEMLAASGDRVVVFELHGYLFFGSVLTLEDRLRHAVSGPTAVEALVLDFAMVTGVDRSAFASIARLLQELRSVGRVVSVSALDRSAHEALLAEEAELATHVAFAPSLDAALEEAEDRLLMSAPGECSAVDEGMPSPQLRSECAAFAFKAGAVVMAQGLPTSGIMIVYRGRLAESRLGADGTRTRLRRFGEFAVAGTAGLGADAPRASEVVAETDVYGWWLSTDRYRELRESKPWIIFELHEHIARVEAERVTSLGDPLTKS